MAGIKLDVDSRQAKQSFEEVGRAARNFARGGAKEAIESARENTKTLRAIERATVDLSGNIGRTDRNFRSFARGGAKEAADTAQATSRALEETDRATVALSGNLGRTDRSLRDFARGGSRQAADAASSASQAIEQASRATVSLSGSIGRTDRNFRDLARGGATQASRSARDVSGAFRDAARNVDRTGDEASETAGSFDRAARSADAMGTEVARNSDRAGGALRGLRDRVFSLQSAFAGLGAGLAIREAVTSFSTFEERLVQVGRVANIQGEALDALGEDIQRIGREVPVATERLLELGGVAGQLGVQGADNISQFAETLGRLETATDVAGEQGARSLARLLTITTDSVEDVDRLGSSITALGNNFATTETEILRVANFLGSSTAQFDLASSEVAGLSAALSALGQRAEASGSAVGAAFAEINNVVSAGGEELQTLARITGQSVGEFASNFRDDAVGAVLDFGEALSDLPIAEQNEVLEELGLAGRETSRVLNALFGNTELVRGALETANSEFSDNQALNIEAARAAETFSSQMQFLGNALDEVAVVAGGELAPIIVGLANDFTDFISEARDAGEVEEFFEGIASAADAAATGIRFVAENIDTVITAGGALAGARIAGTFATLASNAGAAAGGIRAVSAALLAIPGARVVALIGAAIGGVTASLAQAGNEATNLTRETGALIAQRDFLISQAGELREAGGFAPPDLIQRIADLNARLAESEQAARVASDGFAEIAGAAGDADATVDTINNTAERTAGIFGEAATFVDRMASAIDEQARAAERAEEAQRRLNGAIRSGQRDTEAGTGAIADNVDKQREAIREQREAALAAEDTGEALQDAGDDARTFGDENEDVASFVEEAWRNASRSIQSELADAFRTGSLELSNFVDIARNAAANVAASAVVEGGTDLVQGALGGGSPSGAGGGLDLASLGRSASNLIGPGNISADAVAQGAANFAPSVFSTGAVEAGSGQVAANTAAQTLGTAANFAPTVLTAANIGRTFASGDVETGVQQTAGAIGGFAFGGPTGSAIGATLLPAISDLTDALGPFEALVNPVGFVSGLFGGGSGADDSDLDTRIGRNPSNPGRGTNLPGGFANVFVDADSNFTTEGANQVEDAISNFIGPQLEAINDSIFEITGQTISDFASGVRKTGDFKEDFLNGNNDFRDVINLVLQDTVDVVAESASREANNALRNGDLVASTLDVVSQDRELAGAFAGQLAQINQTGSLGEIERVFTAISNIEPSDPQQLRQVINFATTFDDQLSALSGGVQNFSESIRGGVVQNLDAVAQQLSEFEDMTARAFGADAPEVDQAREAGADFLRRLVGIRQTEAESVTQTTAEIQRLDVLLEEATPLLDQYGVSLDAATEAIEAQQAEILGVREAGLQLEAAGLSQTGSQLVQVGQSLEDLRTDAEAAGLSAGDLADIIDGRFNAALSGVSQDQIPELISIFEGLEGTIPGLDTVLAELGERVNGTAGAISDAASLTAREGAQIRGEFGAIFGPQGIQGQLQSLGIAGTELGSALASAEADGIRPGTQAAEDFGERLIDLANGDLDLATAALRLFGEQVAEVGRQAQEAANIEFSRQESLGNRPLVELSPSELLSERGIQLPRTSETTVPIDELSTGQLRSIIGDVITEEIDAGNQPVGTITPEGSDRSTTFALSTERDKSFFDSRTADQILDFINSPNNSLLEDVQERLPTEGGGLTEAASTLRSAFSDLQEFAEDREGVPDETIDRVFDAIDAVNAQNPDFDERAASSLASDIIDAAEPQPGPQSSSSNANGSSASSVPSAPSGPSDDQLTARLQVRNPDLFPGEPTLDTRIQARGLGGTSVAGVLQDADLSNLDLSGAQDLAAELVDVAANGDNAAQAVDILNTVLSESGQESQDAAQAERELTQAQQSRTEFLRRDESPQERVDRLNDQIEGPALESQSAINDFVEGLDLSTKAGREAFRMAQNLAPALGQLASEEEQAQRQIEQARQQRAQLQVNNPEIFGDPSTPLSIRAAGLDRAQIETTEDGFRGTNLGGIVVEAQNLADAGNLTQDALTDLGERISDSEAPIDNVIAAIGLLNNIRREEAESVEQDAQERRSAVQSALSDVQSIARREISALEEQRREELNAIRERRDAAVEAFNDERDALRDTISARQTALRDLDRLNGALEGLAESQQADDLTTRSTRRGEAQADLRAVLSAAREGDLPTAEEVSDIRNRLGRPDPSGFATREAFLRDAGRARAQAQTLEEIAASELSTAERQLEAAEDRLDQAERQQERLLEELRDQEEATESRFEREITAINDQVAAAEKAANAALGQEQATISLEAAINNVEAAINALDLSVTVDGGDGSSGNSSGGGSNSSSSGTTSMATSEPSLTNRLISAGGGGENLDFGENAGAFTSTTASAVRSGSPDLREALASQIGLSGFADGGAFDVNGTFPSVNAGRDDRLVSFAARTGERVTVQTPDQLSQQAGGANEIVAAIQRMTQEINDLRQENRAQAQVIAGNTRDIRNVTRRWDRDNVPVRIEENTTGS